MTPVNQVILGNPLLTQEDLNSRLELMKQYETKLMSLNKPNTIWDDIDRELKSMTDSQKRKLSENSDYVKVVSSLQEIVQDELMNLVKDKILLRNDGKVLLDKQLNLIKILKDKIVEETNYEMELFKKFKEASINNPDLTYNEFYEAENKRCGK